MIDVNELYKIYVKTPALKLMERLDEYDSFYEKAVENRDKEIEDFIAFYNKKQADLRKAETDKDREKLLDSHFGVTPDFINSFDVKIKEVNEVIERMEKERFEISTNIISSIIMKDSSEEEIKYKESIENEFQEILGKIEELRVKIQNDNVIKNRNYKMSVEADNEIFLELQSKKEQLLQYSDKITDNCALWGISPLDLDIDNDTFTLDELNNLYDKYLESMEKEETSGNIIRVIRAKFPDLKVQGVLVLVAIILCFTPILNILSLIFFGGIAYGQIKNKNKAKYYSVLGAITFKIDPMSLSTSMLDESKLLPEELTEEMIEEDPRFDKFCDLIDEIMEREEFKGSVKFQDALNDFSLKRDGFNKEINKIGEKWTIKKECILTDLEKEVEFLKDAKAKALEDYQKFGLRFDKRLVFDSNFVFGIEGDINEQYVDVGLNNVIIRPYNNARVHDSFLRVLYMNIITHINPTNIVVYIYDPNNRGSLFMPFYREELKDVMKIQHNDLTKIIDELRGIADTNLKDLQGRTIHEYNQKAMNEGLTPKKYHLLFILSQPKNVEEDEALRAFFDYSTNVGIMIYMVSDNMQSRKATTFRRPFDDVDDPLVGITDQECRDFAIRHAKAYKNLAPKGGILWTDFINKAFKPEQFWSGNGSSFIDIYPGFLNGDPSEVPIFPFGNEGDIHMIGVGGTGAGKSVFINHCIATATWLYSPRELELWLADFKGVEFTFYLGSEKFPAILPHMAACLCTADPDFATSLFKAFRDMADFRYEEMKGAGVKNMPGWNDLVVQNVSMSKQSGEEMRKPQALIDLHRDDKSPYNPIWTDEDYWPRVWFIVDEFQVIFEKADPKNLESINADITQISKVARAAGAHIFFTSQSMKKTVSADILNQFSLRFGLRCAEDTSQDIMGSKLSSSITAKNGWLYVKTVSLKPEEAKFIKTPFIEDKEKDEYQSLTLEAANVDYSRDSYIEAADKLHASPLHAHIARLADEAKKRGMLRKIPPVKYSESDECKFEYLENAFKNKAIIAKLPKFGVFFLGDRMAYSANQAPENVILGAKNNTHIFSVFNDNQDPPKFFKSLMYNIKHNTIEKEIIEERKAMLESRLKSCTSDEERASIENQLKDVKGQTILIHASSNDLGYVMEADLYLDERLAHFYDEKVKPIEILNWVEKVMESRRANPKEKERPIWVFCLGWDKAQGVGVDPDHMMRGKMTSILSLCGELNIHFIFICSSLGKITEAVFSTCNILIAGRVDSDTSIMLMKSKIANKTEPKNGWMYIRRDGKCTRVKIYQSEITREIAADEIYIQ